MKDWSAWNSLSILPDLPALWKVCHVFTLPLVEHGFFNNLLDKGYSLATSYTIWGFGEIHYWCVLWKISNGLESRDVFIWSRMIAPGAGGHWQWPPSDRNRPLGSLSQEKIPNFLAWISKIPSTDILRLGIFGLLTSFPTIPHIVARFSNLEKPISVSGLCMISICLESIKIYFVRL